MNTNREVFSQQPEYQRLLAGLRQAGLRLTPQRMAVAQALAGNRDHPTAQALHRSLHSQFPSLSLATVYHTLDRLADLGLVFEVGQAPDGSVHYDADPNPHFNLICMSCGKIEDVTGPAKPPRLQQVSRWAGYEIHGARLVYYGLCPKCRQARRPRTRRKAG